MRICHASVRTSLTLHRKANLNLKLTLKSTNLTKIIKINEILKFKPLIVNKITEIFIIYLISKRHDHKICQNTVSTLVKLINWHGHLLSDKIKLKT